MCTIGDECIGGECEGQWVDCDDGVPCTVDYCLVWSGCVHEPDDTACVDGSECTADWCNGPQGCVFEPVDCDDGVVCSDDGCDPTTGCTHEPSFTNACDDGDACTQGDTCQGVATKVTRIVVGFDEEAPWNQPEPEEPQFCPAEQSLTNLAAQEALPEEQILADPSVPGWVTGDVSMTFSYAPPTTTIVGASLTIDIADARGNLVGLFGGTSDSFIGMIAGDETKIAVDHIPAPPSYGWKCPSEWAGGGDYTVEIPHELWGDIASGSFQVTIDTTCCDPVGVWGSNRAILVIYEVADLCVGAPLGSEDCDDGNPCTADTCPSAAGCAHDALPDDTPACPPDGLWCTLDQCVGGSCGTLPLDPASCLIDGECYPEGYRRPGLSCEVCDPAANPTGWTTLDDGESCDADGDGCTVGDFCQAGSCVAGPPFDCSSLDDVCRVGECITLPDGQSLDCEANPSADGTACSDGIACTDDACQAGVCVSSIEAGVCLIAGVCIDSGAESPSTSCLTCDPGSDPANWTPRQDGTQCDDGDVCTLADACQSGGCLGSPDGCDDGSSCTMDACISGAGCQHDLNSGWCLVDSQCVPDGASEPGNPCRVCDAAISVTGFIAVPNGTTCDGDSDGCTLDTCADGECAVGPAPDCSALEDACNDSRCISTGGSSHMCEAVALSAETLCDDDDACTERDACSTGVCVGAAVWCDDGNECTTETCDPTTGCLVQPLSDVACDDGDACSTADACAAGACTGEPVTCGDDGIPCTTDVCNPSTGACGIVVADSTACDDGSACTYFTACYGGVCGGGNLVQCGDSEQCTTDACDPTSGCVHTPLPDGTACDDDDDVCTPTDACVSGVCSGTPLACLDDGNPCTDVVCAEQSGGCISVTRSGACDDGNPCTSDDVCTQGTCTGIVTVLCEDDGVPCTVDVCNPATGECGVQSADWTLCDDGDVCTTYTLCVQGACGRGSPVSCNDGDPCTADSCDPVSGCEAEPLADGEPCDDGDPCTTANICFGQVCAGSPTNCDDGDPCTLDLCSSQSGCVHPPGEEGVPCLGPDPCVVSACAAGACAPAGTVTNCDDGLPCTVDACEGLTGDCRHEIAFGDCLIDGACFHNGDENPAAECEQCLAYVDPASWTVTEGFACTGDGLSCTSDECHASGACTHVIGPSQCAVDATCYASGVANPTDPCLVCDPSTSQEAWTPVPDGGACQDGDGCTEGETCQGSVCAGGAPVVCESPPDAPSCRIQVCQETSPTTYLCVTQVMEGSCFANEHCYDEGDSLDPQCSVCDPTNDPMSLTQLEGPCDYEDGNPCTLPGQCIEGSCTAVPMDCPATSECTMGTCWQGECGVLAIADGTPCTDDGDPGTTDLCLAGECVHQQPQCDVPGCYEVACDADCTCVPTATPRAAGASCDGGDACFQWGCDGAGACVAGAAVVCDSDDPCTADTCDPETGCELQPAEAASHVDAFLNAAPAAVGQAIVWWAPDGLSPGDSNSSGFRSYADWTPSMRGALGDAFAHAVRHEALNVTEPPPNLANHYGSDGAWRIRTIIAFDEAQNRYLSHVAYSLAADMCGWVSWGLADHASEVGAAAKVSSADPSAQLDYPAQMREVLGHARWVDSVVCAGTEDGEGEGTYTTGCQPLVRLTEGVQGRLLPAQAERVWDFLVDNDILDPTSSEQTLIHLLEWGRDNLTHIQSFSEEKCTHVWQWQYEGVVPQIRMMEGTFKTSPPIFPSRRRHFTYGCWGTSEFVHFVLKIVDIPVTMLASSAGHQRFYAINQDMGVAHGDDVYYGGAGGTPPFPEGIDPSLEEIPITAATITLAEYDALFDWHGFGYSCCGSVASCASYFTCDSADATCCASGSCAASTCIADECCTETETHWSAWPEPYVHTACCARSMSIAAFVGHRMGRPAALLMANYLSYGALHCRCQELGQLDGDCSLEARLRSHLSAKGDGPEVFDAWLADLRQRLDAKIAGTAGENRYGEPLTGCDAVVSPLGQKEKYLESLLDPPPTQPDICP